MQGAVGLGKPKWPMMAWSPQQRRGGGRDPIPMRSQLDRRDQSSNPNPAGNVIPLATCSSWRPEVQKIPVEWRNFAPRVLVRFVDVPEFDQQSSLGVGDFVDSERIWRTVAEQSGTLSFVFDQLLAQHLRKG